MLGFLKCIVLTCVARKKDVWLTYCYYVIALSTMNGATRPPVNKPAAVDQESRLFVVVLSSVMVTERNWTLVT